MPTDADAQHQSDDSLVVEDEPIDLSDLRWEDSIALVVFWVLAFVVFLQFFTRYVLNDSLGWTEEIARYLLIAVTFIGSVMAVRKESHIAVEVFHRWMSRPVRRAVQAIVDAIAIVFFGWMAWTCAELAQKTGQKMVSIDIPKSLIYWVVDASFLAMFAWSLWLAWRHFRTGTSRLIDPDSAVEAPRGID